MGSFGSKEENDETYDPKYANQDFSEMYRFGEKDKQIQTEVEQLKDEIQNNRKIMKRMLHSVSSDEDILIQNKFLDKVLGSVQTIQSKDVLELLRELAKERKKKFKGLYKSMKKPEKGKLIETEEEDEEEEDGVKH